VALQASLRWNSGVNNWITAYRRGGGQNCDIVPEQISGIAGLALHHEPFALRRQQDRFDPLDNIHDAIPQGAGSPLHAQTPVRLATKLSSTGQFDWPMAIETHISYRVMSDPVNCELMGRLVMHRLSPFA
jgi:hypothetical protein